ncbi:molybdate ABC transporter permease subunit [Cohnella sp. GCM10027633]|uniref:molybdate ABC transporter permease subunit n=1 Tax=unclassified Cohnella TaxID=2636738 RepID=UPI003638308A
MTINGQDLIAPILISVKVALISSIIAFVFAVAAARWTSRRRFRGQSLVETAFLLPLVLPPTVVGFALLVALGRRSWIGESYEWLTGQPVLFTWIAATIAASVVAFPLAYRTIKVGFEEVEPAYEDAARSMGASEWQVFRFITVPLASRALVAGYILGFARALGEFGATLMVAGNIPHRTQTIPTAIYLAVDGGLWRLAWTWAIVMAILSFLLLLAAGRYSRR